MRTLSLNEINRTAFVCETKENFDNHRCTYCKNEHTSMVYDELYLNPFKTFYKLNTFKVIHCDSCSATWSLMAPKVQNTEHKDG